MLDDFLAHDVSGLLPGLEMPALMIAAENDNMVHPGLAAEAARRTPRGRHVTLRGATHWCLVENADEVVREMTLFLGQSERAPVLGSAPLAPLSPCT
jgi:pimeloyl-ACP methyl ester carboxylesterase